MTKDELAAKLNNREYLQEITDAEALEAAQHELVVIFGYSDDNVELKGAIDDEISAYGGTEFNICRDGLLDSFEDLCDNRDEDGLKAYFAQKAAARTIKALWDEEKPYSWTYQTEIPHASFEIREDGEPYCRGIVVSLSEITPAEQPEETAVAG